MTDEGFYLSPVDVRRWDFGQKLRGCDPAKVEDFRNQVALELERLTRINQDLEAKAKGFHEQLRAFRERDKALNDALVSAQQLRSEIREQAEREKGLVLRQAQMEAERIVESARAQIGALRNEISALEKSRRAYLAQFRAMIDKQLAELTALDGMTAPQVIPPAIAALPDAMPSAELPSQGGPPRSNQRDAAAVEAELREILKTPDWLESFAQEQ